MTTSNGYYDVEGDLQGGIEINKYINGVLAGNTDETTETNDLATGDKIKTGVIVYDLNGVRGEEVFSNEVTLQASLYRTLSGIILEHWSQTPDENVLVKTSVEEILTNANGEYSLLASIGREDVLVLKEGRLESGYILTPGTNDVTVNHEISDDTQENGIDRWLLKNYVLKDAVGGLGMESHQTEYTRH